MHVQEDDKFDNHRQFGLMVTVACLIFLRMHIPHDVFSHPGLMAERVERHKTLQVMWMWVKYGGQVATAWRMGIRGNRGDLLDKLHNYAFHTARAGHQTQYQRILMMRAMNRYLCTHTHTHTTHTTHIHTQHTHPHTGMVVAKWLRAQPLVASCADTVCTGG